jgi:phosphohistidine swiveling domain-containing protein
LSIGSSRRGERTKRPEPAGSEPWILPLDAPEASLEVAGGKGASLALLAARGLAVPAGFLVSTAGYRAYVAHNDLDRAIAAALAGLDARDPAALEAASAAIRDLFSTGAMPPDLATALRAAYKAFGAPPVAVRSSATAEDLPELSFAGQQDTSLNVVGAEALRAAVIHCWSSLWTARALGYRARNGIPHQGLALAVVVQEMVPAEAAGVLFTANPLDGKRTEMVVEATLGLGEALVSGQVEPDHYRVEAASGRIVEKRLGAKALSIRARPGGGTEAQPEKAATRQALPDAAIAELVELGREVAGLFGAPQDVEWAWAGGQIHLLQSRPITSLFPLPPGMGPEPLQVLISFAVVQGMLDPMTPLGLEAVRALLAGAGSIFGYKLTVQSQKAVHAAAERLWINITGLFHHRLGRPLVHAFPAFIEPGIKQAVALLLQDPRLAASRGLSLRGLRRVLPVALPAIGRLLHTLLRPDAGRARFDRDLEERLAEVEARCAAAATLAQRVALMEDMLIGAFPFLLPRFIPRFGAAMGPLNLLLRLSASLPGGRVDALAMTRGLPHNVTTQMDLDLWRTAQAIQADRAALAHFQRTESGVLAAEYLAGHLPRVAQSALDGFLARYGVRGVGEIDLGRPRWREDPAPVMHALQSYLQIQDPDQAPDAVFRRGAAAAADALEELVAGLRATRGGWFKARLARGAARRMRALGGLRESPKFWAVRNMGLVRSALLDSGQALVQSGVLARPDDLFFLQLAELEALAAGEEQDWAALVGQRRRTYDRELRRTQIPRLLLSDGQAFYEGVASQAGAGVLAGSPVSPGVVEGPVRIVYHPHDARLAPGEILVCPATDPAWTPLFLVAGGLVMEVGGLMTHGSVVAREYGIPAVVGVSRATERLRTGQRVRVDGTVGQVTILEAGNLPAASERLER